jgi:hypothetical protein
VISIPGLIDEVVVGQNHVLVLTEGEVWTWGNAPCMKLTFGSSTNSISKIAAGGGDSVDVSCKYSIANWILHRLFGIQYLHDN